MPPTLMFPDAVPSPWVCRFLLVVRPAGRVLYVAAGGGRHVRAIRASGRSVVAVDRDGGKGGSVYARAVRDVLVLAKYKNIKEFKAESGQAGAKNSRHGANGESL